MRHVVLGSLALVVSACVAQAADRPSRQTAVAPVLAAPVFNWSGAYIGASLGYGWTQDRFTGWDTVRPTIARTPFKVNGTGILGGIYAGYNHRYSNNIVAGIEADVETTGIRVRARLGYAAGSLMPYLTGGIAVADVNTKFSGSTTAGGTTASFSHSFHDRRFGWTVGAGVDYAMTPNWILRAEYRYSYFGRWDNVVPDTPASPAGAGSTYRHEADDSTVRVGVAYKF